MKLGVFLLVIGIGDILLTLASQAWFGFHVRGVIDVILIVWGIYRIDTHQAKKQQAKKKSNTLTEGK